GRVKKLLEIVADTLIAYLRLLKRELGYTSYPGNNYPSLGSEDIGFCVADDTALIPLSPAMYEEFCLPTLQRLAAEAAGLFIHSCGCYNHQIDNLLRIPRLRAIQIHSGPGEADPAPAWQKIYGRAALWSDTGALSLGDAYRDRWWACYEEYVLPRLLAQGVTGLVIQSPPAPTAAERQANVERLRRILGAAIASPQSIGRAPCQRSG
ncbi:MAG: uroporphyrinogen decarboxylase family protein, partial [Planctomycetota bacterium]|nr:uroporphyrinogen decarboxylase family protein [Planctomycetota bacterium]